MRYITKYIENLFGNFNGTQSSQINISKCEKHVYKGRKEIIKKGMTFFLLSFVSSDVTCY